MLQPQRTPLPYTPLCLSKAVKNPTEIQGMRTAHVRTFGIFGTFRTIKLAAARGKQQELSLPPSRSRTPWPCVNSSPGWRRR